MMKKLKILFVTLFDRRTPWVAKLIVIAGALYGISPADLIPDFIPVLGQLDDVTIILIVLYFYLKLTKDVRKDLHRKM